MPSVDDIPQMKEAGLEDVFDRSLATFAGRLATFEKYNWPHGDDETCTAEKMADAGFYMVENEEEEDLARCFYCRRELSGWEPQDDPWQEHKRKPCPFIKLGKTARNLTVKDQIELEAERTRIIVMKRQEVAEAEYRLQAEKVKLEIIKLASKRK